MTNILVNITQPNRATSRNSATLHNLAPLTIFQGFNYTKTRTYEQCQPQTYLAPLHQGRVPRRMPKKTKFGTLSKYIYNNNLPYLKVRRMPNTEVCSRAHTRGTQPHAHRRRMKPPCSAPECKSLGCCIARLNGLIKKGCVQNDTLVQNETHAGGRDADAI